MSTVNRIKGRSISSRAKSVFGVGLGSVLMLAGVTLVGVLPASAAVSTLTFSTQPPTSAIAGQGISFAVNVTSGGASGDTIAITSTNCTLAGGASQTGTYTSGPVAFSGVVILTGTTCNLIASDTTTGDTGTTTSNNITVSAGAATKLVFTTAPPATAGDAVPLTLFKVSTEDVNNNVVTSGSGSTDTIAITSSCALGGTQSATEVAGVASFSALTINQVGNCPLIATDTTSGDTGFTPATSSAVAVSGGVPAKLAFSVAPPASVLTTGTAITAFKVAVEDSAGNVDTTGLGSTDSIMISSPCIATPVSIAAVAGVATFSTVAFTSTGACVLTATDSARVIAAATATSSVGQPQATLTITKLSGYLDAPLTLATTGGSGTGAITYVVTNGTATLCAVSATGVLTAKTGGTCIVTAYKAAVAPYATGISAATTVTISAAPKAVRLAGAITRGKIAHVTITGYNFSGRPKVTSNVPGFKGTVTRDSGKSLSITITVLKTAKAGVKTLSLAFANGKHASVKYSLH